MNGADPPKHLIAVVRMEGSVEQVGSNIHETSSAELCTKRRENDLQRLLFIVVQCTVPTRVVTRVGALGLCDPWTRG